jgi:hypothetical protein
MPFSTTPPVPSTGGIGLQYSLSQATGLPLSVNFTPKNPDGTPFDCSALAGMSGNFDNGAQAPIRACQVLATMSGTGSVSGIKYLFSNSDILAIMSNYSTSGRYSIQAGDGVNTYTVAAGTWSLSYIA